MGQMMSKNLVAALVLKALLLSPISIFAENVIFVSVENLPPKIFKQNGQLKGIYVDTIRLVCKRLNIQPEFRLYPWKRCIQMVKTGKADAIFPPFFTKERAGFLYFPSEPMSYTRNVVFARKNSRLIVEHLDDLKGLLVGVNLGYSYGSEFDTYKENLTLDISIDEKMQILKLSRESPKRIDVAVVSEEPFMFLAKKLGYSELFEIVHILSEQPSYIAFSKATGETGRLLSEKFYDILYKLKNEGEIKKIEDSYLK